MVPASAPELERLHAKVRAGGALNDRDRRTLFQLTRGASGRQDPRPWLVAAYGDLRQGHRTDAMDAYEKAWAASHDARDDATMLSDLVHMAAHRQRASASRAGALVVEAYADDRAEDALVAIARVNASLARRRAAIADDPLIEALLLDDEAPARLAALARRIRVARNR